MNGFESRKKETGTAVTDDATFQGNVAAWLEVDEASSRPFRVERLLHLIDESGDEDLYTMLPGGPVSATALEEARLAYLHGLFLSCIVICQVCMEHMLAGIFRMSGRNDLDRAGFKQLLKEARDEAYISNDEFLLFDQLRTRRNPYVHSRAPAESGSIMRRAVDTNSPYEDLMVHDARSAITALLHLCRRPPFAIWDR